jgi:hypothetical protein
MNEVLWSMPSPSSTLTRGPSFAELPRRQCELSFWFETEDGGEQKAGFHFDGVAAFKCTFMTALSLEMIETAYDKVVRIHDSQWCAEIANRRRSHLDSAQTVGELQHLMICFDDGPCYEFICTAVHPF